MLTQLIQKLPCQHDRAPIVHTAASAGNAGKGSLVVYFEFVHQVGVGGGGGGQGVLRPDYPLDDVIIEREGGRENHSSICM